MTLPERLSAKLPESTPRTIATRGRIPVWDTDPLGTMRARQPLVLLHGWNVDAGLNFANALDALSADHRIVMFDLRGHGQGFRGGRFDLDRCADDVIAVIDGLGIDSFVPVGYSMGGAVAQILARRSPRVAGLVLAATAARFTVTARERVENLGLRVGTRSLAALPPAARRIAFRRIVSVACRRYPGWVEGVVLRADPINLLQAGAAMRRFDSTEWAHELEQPTAVVVTEQDRVVPPERQRALAEAIPGAVIFTVAADHDLPIRSGSQYGPTLRRAVESVLT